MTLLNRDIHRCLICLRCGMGDVISELPALRSLRDTIPHAHITALGVQPATEVLEDFRYVDEIQTIQTWGMKHWGDDPGQEQKEACQQWFASQQFDLLLDVAQAALGIRHILADGATPSLEMEVGLQTELLQNGQGGTHALFESAKTGWGLPPHTDASPRLVLSDNEKQSAHDTLAELGVETDVLIGVCPGASTPLKQWPLQRYVTLISTCLSQNDGEVLLLTGPGEHGFAETFSSQLRHPAKLHHIHNRHLRQVAALLERCTLYIGNDSGLMHLAAAVGTPLTAFFGPSNPSIYLPRHVQAVALQDERYCPHRMVHTFGHSACVFEKTCLSGMNCIQAITMHEAELHVSKSLQRKENNDCTGPEPAAESG